MDKENNTMNNTEKLDMKNEFIKNLSDKERIAMNIAIEHLESSFDIEKCIGFKHFENKYNKKT